MNKNKESKVAVCPKCKKQVLICLVNFLNKKTEKEFTELTNEGFIVKIESVEETRKREMSYYGDCKKICLK